MNLRFRRPFPSDFDVERLSEIPTDPALLYVGEGGGPILRIRCADGGQFILVLPDLGGTPHVMTWPNPRNMFVRLSATTWLINIDRPALEEIDVPLGLDKIHPFAVPKFGVYVMFDGDRVVGFAEEGVRFDFGGYGCNVTNVELQNDTLVVTWWPSGQGKWIDRIDIATGELPSQALANESI